MREEDDADRWPTVNLKADQLEQILATDVVETVRIDNAMRQVLDRLEGKVTPPEPQPRYGAPIGYCTLAIVASGLALLLDSGLWQVTWRLPGVIGSGTVAAVSGITAVVLLVRARRTYAGQIRR